MSWTLVNPTRTTSTEQDKLLQFSMFVIFKQSLLIPFKLPQVRKMLAIWSSHKGSCATVKRMMEVLAGMPDCKSLLEAIQEAM